MNLAIHRTVPPRVRVPALLIHSMAGRSVPFACLQELYEHLGSEQKEMLALDGMDHSLVRDPGHQVVFEAIARFLAAESGAGEDAGER